MPFGLTRLWCFIGKRNKEKDAERISVCNQRRGGNPRKTSGNAGKGGKEFQIENYPCGKRQRGRRAAVDGGYEPGAQAGR